MWRKTEKVHQTRIATPSLRISMCGKTEGWPFMFIDGPDGVTCKRCKRLREMETRAAHAFAQMGAL